MHMPFCWFCPEAALFFFVGTPTKLVEVGVASLENLSLCVKNFGHNFNNFKHEFRLAFCSNRRKSNDLKFLDRQVWANSVDPDHLELLGQFCE